MILKKIEPCYQISGIYGTGQFEHNPPKKVFMASTSKPVIAKVFLENFPENTIELSTDEFKGIINDLFRREQLGLAFDKHFEIYSNLFNSLGFEIHRNMPDEKLKELVEKLKAKKFPPEEKVNFPNMELVNLALWASANYPVDIMRNRLIAVFTADGYVEQVQRYVPNFTPTITTKDFQHWIAPNYNIGRIEEFARFLHEQVKQNLNDPQPESYLKYLLDNDIDWGFDFTNSALGKSLMSRGYKIYEKTGYYPTVNWVSELAEEDFTVHMALSNIVTIVSPEGEVQTFYQSMNFIMPWPNEKIKEDDIWFVNTGSKDYLEKTEKAKVVANGIFREEQSGLILRYYPGFLTL